MIAIYGPAGVGKSTQAQILAKKMRRKWLSAGQIIRDSGKFDNFTSKSAMIDQDVLVDMIAGAVAAAEPQDVVFDGQPGETIQLKYWEETGLLKKLECVIVLRAPEEVLIEHLLGRGRNDDNIENWKTKFRYFEQKSCSFLTEMKRRKVPVYEVSGDGTVEEVEERIEKLIREKVVNF